MVKKEMSSDQSCKKAFWETAFRCVNATHRVTSFPSVFSLITHFSGNLLWDTCERNEACGDKGNILRWKLETSIVINLLMMCEFISQCYPHVSWSSPLSLFLRNLRGLLWFALIPTLIKEISTLQNVKEAFWETSLWSVKTSHNVTAEFSGISLLTLFSWKLQSEIWEPVGARGEKGNILRRKVERSFIRNFFMMCKFISQSYTYVSCCSPLSLFLRNLRRTSLDLIEAYADKGNIISSKRERSFLRNFFVIY